ncbi:hypothetical protein B0T10DRAFT_580920 [Thelonectria olida]|uniref:Uncharacterized protein n=1 Tax=Thelonectria olida TaxID=1576542 RepID=A0A9P8VXN2_9HYPO|nr:hypothetical protein B0T10DRAFT_580920 [Thelonectria olida]
MEISQAGAHAPEPHLRARAGMKGLGGGEDRNWARAVLVIFPGLSEDCARDKSPGGDLGQRELRRRQVSPKGELVPVTTFHPHKSTMADIPHLELLQNLLELLLNLLSIPYASEPELLLLFLSMPDVSALDVFDVFDACRPHNAKRLFLSTSGVLPYELTQILRLFPSACPEYQLLPVPTKWSTNGDSQGLEHLGNRRRQPSRTLESSNTPTPKCSYSDDEISWLLCGGLGLYFGSSKKSLPLQVFSEIVSQFSLLFLCDTIFNLLYRRLAAEHKPKLSKDGNLRKDLEVLYTSLQSQSGQRFYTLIVEDTDSEIPSSEEILERIWSLEEEPSVLSCTTDQALVIAGGTLSGHWGLCLLQGKTPLPQAIEQLRRECERSEDTLSFGKAYGEIESDESIACESDESITCESDESTACGCLTM